MIGNDIVDLLHCRQESNWRRPGWMTKVCTSEEEAYLAGSDDAGTLVWLLWSMKESAYKLWNRSSRQSRFNPSSFSCREIRVDQGVASGIVSYDAQSWHTSSFICTDYIHTLAWEEDNGALPAVYIGRTGSLELILPRNRRLQRDEDGIPYLADERSGRYIPVSFSHHGRFEALATILKQPL